MSTRNNEHWKISGQPDVGNRIYAFAYVLGALLTAASFILVGIDGAEAARRCKSSAYEYQDAWDFCWEQLKCDEKEPPQDMKCTGKTRRWICWCIPKESVSLPEIGIELGIGILRGGRDRDGHRRREHRR